jgi:esterase/lipase superfamily enzyme
MRRAGRSGKLFNVVVMASPDRDYEVFAEQDLPVVLEAAGRVAVYASRHDVALSFSGFIHGRRRAGGPELLAAVDSTALEVIDTSHRSGDFTGHSDYAQSPAVLADIFLLLRGRSPGQRNLVEHPSDRGRHWDFRP